MAKVEKRPGEPFESLLTRFLREQRREERETRKREYSKNRRRGR